MRRLFLLLLLLLVPNLLGTDTRLVPDPDYFAAFTSTTEPDMTGLTYIPIIQDYGTALGSTTTWTVGMPSKLTIGDLVLVFVESANDTAPTMAGWTELPVGSPVGTGAGCPDADTCTALTIFYQIIASTTPSAVVDSGAGDHVVGMSIAVSKDSFNAADPFENNVSTNTQIATTSLTIPGFVTENDNSLVFVIFATPHDGNAGSWVSSEVNTTLWNPRTETANILNLIGATKGSYSDGGGVQILFGYKPTAGATGTTTGDANWSHTSASISFGVNGAAQ